MHTFSQQTGSQVNAAGDKYEQEARRVADNMTSTSAGSLDRQHNRDRSQQHISNVVRQSSSRSDHTIDDSLRTYFEPRFGYDFSKVRILNSPEAARSARACNANAFTVGNNIFFAKGAYNPHKGEGRRLIAHELTHVIQQGAAQRIANTSPSFLTAEKGSLQRDIAEAQLSTTPVEQIMADQHYFENGIHHISFYSAELAILHYTDGSEIRLGLVPDQITAPFEAVDYRTLRSSHITMSSTPSSLGRGSINFLPRGREMQVPPGTSFGDILRHRQQLSRTIRFTHHNGRIVPTEVNTISAPRLSQALREAEAQFVRQFDAMAQGAVEVLQTLEWIIILASLVGGIGAASARAGAGRVAAGRAGAAATAGIAGRAQSTLVRFFTRLLRSGSAETITVEGVGFGGVRAAMRGTELVVSRSTIVNASRIAGRGRLIQSAFEQAAIQTARQAGARTARVALETVINSRWAAYLQSRGYAFQLIANESGGFSNVLTKVITL